jgi:hypothetical protein
VVVEEGGWWWWVARTEDLVVVGESREELNLPIFHDLVALRSEVQPHPRAEEQYECENNTYSARLGEWAIKREREREREKKKERERERERERQVDKQKTCLAHM